MPLQGATNPAALLMQRQGPAIQGGAPSGMPAQNPAGGDPQQAMMAQIAQRILQQQQGTDYLKKMLANVRMMLRKAIASNFLQDPKATSDISSAMQKIAASEEKLSKTGSNQ